MEVQKLNETDQAKEVTSLRSAALSGDTAPQRILVAPWGRVESTNGNFVVDQEGIDLAVAAFLEHGTDLPIDYEHQTLGGSYASPNGQAPAAGWIKAMSAEPEVGLFAEIEWTDQGRELITSKQYRYLSPVAIIRKGDRKLVAIHSAALTNKPAIVGMSPIVNRVQIEDEDACGQPLTMLRSALDLAADLPVHEVLVAAGRRVRDLQQKDELARVEHRVAQAMRDGKLVEAQRAWAEQLVKREEDLFTQWLDTAPVIVTPGASKAPALLDLATHAPRSRMLSARAEYRANPLLQQLTSQQAYLADAERKHARQTA